MFFLRLLLSFPLLHSLLRILLFISFTIPFVSSYISIYSSYLSIFHAPYLTVFHFSSISLVLIFFVLYLSICHSPYLSAFHLCCLSIYYSLSLSPFLCQYFIGLSPSLSLFLSCNILFFFLSIFHSSYGTSQPIILSISPPFSHYTVGTFSIF